ncbi:MAG: AMP-binding protein, partial [Ruegeria sp.]
MLMKSPALPSITEAFRQVVVEHGERAALSFGGEVLSYAAFDQRTDALAARLVAAGVTPGSCVGIAARPGLDTITATLAILKAGAGYVPLPESYPVDRLDHIRTEAEISFVVGRFEALEAMGVVAIDPEGPAPADPPALPETDGESLAYVMYTSGSTGTPKGVAVPHRAILRLVQNPDFMELGPEERILQNSPIAFDAATLEIW